MRRGYIGFVFGTLMGLSLGACATSLFPYNYYGVDLKDSKLLGPADQSYPDLPLSVCAASSVSASPCVAMLTDQYEQMKENYENLENELSACQKAAQ